MTDLAQLTWSRFVVVPSVKHGLKTMFVAYALICLLIGAAGILLGLVSELGGSGPDVIFRDFDSAWFGAAVWAILLFVGWRAGRKRARELRAGYRQLHGLCLTCGYDLRASPERCPECGTRVPATFEGSGADAVGARPDAGV